MTRAADAPIAEGTNSTSTSNGSPRNNTAELFFSSGLAQACRLAINMNSHIRFLAHFFPELSLVFFEKRKERKKKDRERI